MKLFTFNEVWPSSFVVNIRGKVTVATVLFQMSLKKVATIFSNNILLILHYSTLIQPRKGRFTLIYMSPDYLHGSRAGLPG